MIADVLPCFVIEKLEARNKNQSVGGSIKECIHNAMVQKKE